MNCKKLKRFKNLFQKKYSEEDEFERKKELQSQEKPPEPEENFNFLPPSPEKEEGEDADFLRKKGTTFFLQTDYVEQHKGPNNFNNAIAYDLQRNQQFEKDEGPTTLLLDLNKIRSKNMINPTSNAFNLGVTLFLNIVKN